MEGRPMESELIAKSLKDSLKAKEKFFTKKNTAKVIEAAEMIVEVFKADGKLMLAGNGGSAADAQHIAAEFVNRFEIERPPLPAMALSTDTSVLTSIGNDYAYENVFSKQIKALGREGDIFLAISTSGTSPNVVQAVEAAATMGIKTIGLTGKSGGDMAEIVDLLLNVDFPSTPRVQEVHITIAHMICELVDHMLFKKAL